MIRWLTDEEYTAHQAEDLAEIERARLLKALAAALRRAPSPREARRAWQAWGEESALPST